jgi:hypothetical protein
VEAAARFDDPARPAAAQAAFLGPGVAKPTYTAGNAVKITLYGVPGNADPKEEKAGPGISSDPEAATVSLPVVKIGTFDPANGTVVPDASGAPLTLKFTVAWIHPDTDAPRPPGGLRIVRSNLPGGSLVATDQPMKQNFQAHYIYWWNKSHDGVIPDLRYVPISHQTPVRAATEIVGWVLSGNMPSWILPAADRVVTAATMADTFVGVATDPDRFTVNLAAAAAGNKQLPLLATQLRMSIGRITPNGTDPTRFPVALEILVGGQSQVIDQGNDWRSRARNFPAPHTGAKAYAIVDGKVRPLESGPDGLVPAKITDLPSALATPANANAIFAAVDRTQGSAAIVQEAADGKQTLTVVRAGTAAKVLPGGQSFIRPQWVNSTVKVLLVGVDGKLYTVNGANKAMRVLNTPTSGISAFAVAPDGERIAFVSAGRLYLAVLDLSGEPQLTPPVQINVRGSLASVTAVSWGPSEVSLLVGGASSLIVMDMYGLATARYFAGSEAVPQPVEALASVPYDLFGAPTDDGQIGPMMAAGGRLYTSANGVGEVQPKGMSSPFFGA